MISLKKYQHCKNSFIIFDATSHSFNEIFDIILRFMNYAKCICSDTHGAGADGIVILLSLSRNLNNMTRVIIINADGSIARNCGNGLMCVAKWLFDAKLIRNKFVFGVATDSGIKKIKLLNGAFLLDIGFINFIKKTKTTCVSKYFSFKYVTVGNLHSVILSNFFFRQSRKRVNNLISSKRVNIKTNVGFSNIANKTEIGLIVHERGVGITESCGTGACAMVAMFVFGGLLEVGKLITVDMPGGSLSIEINTTNCGKIVANMLGLAEEIFSEKVYVDI